MASLLVARMSSAEKRQSTEVAGLCNETVGNNSSAAGTKSGKWGEGVGSDPGGLVGDTLLARASSGRGNCCACVRGDSELLIVFGGGACCPNGKRVAGGTMGEQRVPLSP